MSSGNSRLRRRAYVPKKRAQSGNCRLGFVIAKPKGLDPQKADPVAVQSKSKGA